ncbi:MAG: 3-deoxy-manno-octulosonate cytidylyltransferase [Cytophagaceae bacterium]|jgi:3-deoxy-manno-octulosonate cytidylyltransferase (CMP-KDO synthetase)|nr:3-deoxy-manno-octulosonate cytidylyltransferase [Cytophagaceae bacterium]
MPSKILAVIPARYASTRFPGKPLISIQGKSMIQRVYEQVIQVPEIHSILIATDDDRIESEVKSFGGPVIRTASEHPSGTDRVFEAYVKSGSTADFILNVQGDEPFIQPEQIQILIQTLHQDTEIATLIKPIEDVAILDNPNIVKTVINKKNQALYFSRHAIPFQRNRIDKKDWLSGNLYYKHIGLYAYRSDILAKITELEPSYLERSESLEQLRWLENGYTIQTALTHLETIGIDTPDDLKKIPLI